VTAPDPEGSGAARAIRIALDNAGVSPDQVDYVNLHGTGTPDNDAAEAKAVRAVFGERIPPVSSTKGIYGHPLAAAGAVEAVLGALSIREGFVPPNTGCEHPAPDLGVVPALQGSKQPVDVVLSNSFGFGGNNACIVLSRADRQTPAGATRPAVPGFRVQGSACLTGAGSLEATLSALESSRTCRGTTPDEDLTRNLDPASVRRMKRLPRLTLALAVSAHENAGTPEPPGSVYFGTGLGALSETHDFLARLFKSGGKFSSPTDFVGSLHNSPAGQVALHFQSRGANVTATGTDDSFEQALTCASLLARDEETPLLCLAADEAHSILSPLIDRSTRQDDTLSDGGGALILEPVRDPDRAHLLPVFLGYSPEDSNGIPDLIRALGGTETINQKFGALFAGIPWASQEAAREQLERFLKETGFSGPVVDYRRVLGNYATVSAAACVLALNFVRQGRLPPAMAETGDGSLQGRGILMIGLGPNLSAVAANNV
jgi:3-oxoacyl-[acyl-carrier-protein] synthase-1/3-oxoacyl-[acyl-carrier-protein] synthase II